MPPVTLAIIIANVAVYLAQQAIPGLVIPFALWPIGSAAASGGQVGFEVWQLLTYGFLHGGLLHLAFNMFAVYMFGGALEQVVGQRRYLVYYLVCVLAAGLTQLLVTSDQKTADALAAKAIDHGFMSTFVERAGATFKVRVKFSSETEARANEAKLKELSKDVWIVK